MPPTTNTYQVKLFTPVWVGTTKKILKINQIGKN